MSEKRVLILAYDFPPYVSVGALRPFSWYRFFPEFNIYPIVITRQWDNHYANHLDFIAPGSSPKAIVSTTEGGTIIQSPYFPTVANKIMLKYGPAKFILVRKFISAYFEFLQFVLKIGPKSTIYREATEYLKKNKVDAIIATGEPYVLFSYASSLSRKFNIPWIADYRDPWTQKKEVRTNPIARVWFPLFERKIVPTASFVTTVSPFFASFIKRQVPAANVAIIENGFDELLAKEVEHISQESGYFSIALTGTIYPWHPFVSILEVINGFISNKGRDAKLRLHLYGINFHNQGYPDIETMIKNEFPGLMPYVVYHKRLSNKDLLKDLARRNVMLLFNDYSIMGTKIYDYLAVRRKIIFCYTESEVSANLREKYFPLDEKETTGDRLQETVINVTNAGTLVKNADDLQKILEELYNEFLNNGRIACDSINFQNYSRKNSVKGLAELIEKLNVKNEC